MIGHRRVRELRGATVVRRLALRLAGVALAVLLLCFPVSRSVLAQAGSQLGREVSVARHLVDDEEFRISVAELLAQGQRLFTANWTEQEGGGRPLTKGTGKQLSDPSAPLTGKRAFNRISAPDANSCAGCHNVPYGIPGGAGDFVTNVFVLGHRFDFATFDPNDSMPTRGSADENGRPLSLQTAANLRASTAMFGAGYIEMLARQMTADLQAIRDGLKLGESGALGTKGVSFGTLTRRSDATWDTSKVEGLPRMSLVAPTPLDRPTLIVRPWHQAGNVVSLREFSNNAYNHHHGIQTVERFGRDTDLDGDGFVDEMTRADVTAVSVWQATLAVPGRVIPRDVEIEKAVINGEAVFSKIRCARCHVTELPLDNRGWIYTEPNPYNPPTNLRPGDARTYAIDLTSAALPAPRLPLVNSHESPVVMVPAYTDLKLHDITNPADPAEAEALDMNWFVWSPRFTGGNRRFLTKRLWGSANEPPYFHHGLFTTMRQAVLAHDGEALAERRAFQALPKYDQDSLIEFLKTLQVLPPGTKDLIVDEKFQSRPWPPLNATSDEPPARRGAR
jgi:Di-haem oxidoreductase, putative peroxidase